MYASFGLLGLLLVPLVRSMNRRQQMPRAETSQVTACIFRAAWGGGASFVPSTFLSGSLCVGKRLPMFFCIYRGTPFIYIHRYTHTDCVCVLSVFSRRRLYRDIIHPSIVSFMTINSRLGLSVTPTYGDNRNVPGKPDSAVLN